VCAVMIALLSSSDTLAQVFRSDLDGNGTVDSADYQRFQPLFWSNDLAGDFSNDSVVDNKDVAIMMKEWGGQTSNHYRFSLVQDTYWHDPQCSEDFKWYMGGVFTHDVNNDGSMDFVVTLGDKIVAYSQSGSVLWEADGDGIKICDYRTWSGLTDRCITNSPGLNHPGAIAGDTNGDGKQEVAYLTKDDKIRILDGDTGDEIAIYNAPKNGNIMPCALMIANLNGNGDREIVVESIEIQGHYQEDHYLTALDAMTGNVVWPRKKFTGIDHSPVKNVDIDNDGLDEFVGVNILDHDGTILNAGVVDNLKNSGRPLEDVDAVAVRDIDPSKPGLESAIAEQNGQQAAIAMTKNSAILDIATPNGCDDLTGGTAIDCDKVVVGDFDTNIEGQELFCRSDCGLNPWLLSTKRERYIAAWRIPEVAPNPEWYDNQKCKTRDSGGNDHYYCGIEDLFVIDWDNDPADDMLVKQRHTNGNVAIIDPLTGHFDELFDGLSAIRIYAADFARGPKEEFIVINEDGMVDVFLNPNDSATGNNKWNDSFYRRGKQNFNYYSTN